MNVNVKLFATLRDGRFKAEMANLDDKSRIVDVIHRYDIPPDEVAIRLVNGRHADDDQILNDGDTLSLFPPVGGG